MDNDLRHFQAPDAFDIFSDDEKLVILFAIFVLALFL